MITNQSWLKKICLAVLCLMLTAAFLHTTVSAEEAFRESEDITLTICYEHEGKPVEGAVFHIYYVAGISDSQSYVLTDDFKNYPVSMNGLDSAGWKALALTLKGYAVRDQIEPLESLSTAEDGTLCFSKTAGLPAGLYLVTGDAVEISGRVYESEPFFVSLPAYSEEDGWVYAVTARPKASDVTEITKVEAVKIWNDRENSRRPDRVEIQLICDGRLYDTAILSEENQWRNTWENLETGHIWIVTEKNVEDGYTVSVERNQTSFYITNTMKDDTPDEPDTPELPNTGTSKWMVPVLAACGMLLFLIGWIKRQKDGGNDIK